jgi:hypothetical protein
MKPVVATMLILAALVFGTDVPGVNQLVCQQLSLGQPPSQIAEELHNGNPTIPLYIARGKVWEAIMTDCP